MLTRLTTTSTTKTLSMREAIFSNREVSVDVIINGRSLCTLDGCSGLAPACARDDNGDVGFGGSVKRGQAMS